jgi:hypothetical protein
VTGPVGAGGRPTVLTVGGSAQMLTEFASTDPPLLVINTSNDLAWVSGDSSVGSSSGVPLEPGTSLPWAAGGQVWAVADPAAAAPITVYITSAAQRWDPSPAAIGAIVAAQLLAGGVPNVLVTDTVLASQNVNNGPPVVIDVHKYASLTVEINNVLATPQVITINYLDANGNAFDSTNFTIPGSIAAALILPVRTPKISVASDNVSGVIMTVYGSNRTVDKPRVSQRNMSKYATSSAGPWVANTPVDLGLTTIMDGLVTASIMWAATSTNTGVLCMTIGQTAGGINDMIPIVSTVDGQKIGSRNYVSRLFAHPVSPAHWWFIPGDATSATAFVGFTGGVS